MSKLDKVSVNPKNIRCLGNIVSPKTAVDFGTVNGTISSGTDSVNTQSMTVYTTDYLVGSTITLSGDRVIEVEDTSFTVTATLKDNTDTVVTGATVYCDVNGTVMEATTNSSGVASFTISTDGSAVYSIRCYYNGSDNLAGSSAYTRVYCADADTIEVYGTQSIIQTGETIKLIGVLKSITGDEMETYVPGVRVEFYITDEE